jgi:quercetin dioxygenase-like cupin family protein
VKRLRFGTDAAFAPRDDLLEGVTVAPLTASIAAGSAFQAAVFRLAAGGRIARHPARCPQILAVVEGTGVVSGADGATTSISAGDAVYWDEGEEHETRTDAGLTALIIEGPGLVPYGAEDDEGPRAGR